MANRQQLHLLENYLSRKIAISHSSKTKAHRNIYCLIINTFVDLDIKDFTPWSCTLSCCSEYNALLTILTEPIIMQRFHNISLEHATQKQKIATQLHGAAQAACNLAKTRPHLYRNCCLRGSPVLNPGDSGTTDTHAQRPILGAVPTQICDTHFHFFESPGFKRSQILKLPDSEIWEKLTYSKRRF
jgi:hypothetical protein